MIWWAGTFSVSLTELAGKGGEPGEKNQIWKCNQTCELQHFCIFVASSLSSCVFSLCISLFPQMLLICCHLMNVCFVCFGFVSFYATLYLFIWRFYTKKPAVSAFSHVDTNPRIASVVLASWQYQNIVGTQGCVFNLQGGAWQNKFVWSILELSLAHNIRWKYYVKAHLVLCGIIQHQCCVVRGEWVDQNT